MAADESSAASNQNTHHYSLAKSTKATEIRARRLLRVHCNCMPRLAWFSPLPPVRSGIARYCSELLPGLAAEYDIDLFVDGPPATFESPDERVHLYDAHEFMWKNRAR